MMKEKVRTLRGMTELEGLIDGCIPVTWLCPNCGAKLDIVNKMLKCCICKKVIPVKD